MAKWVECWRCRGTGKVWSADGGTLVCEACSGSGSVRAADDDEPEDGIDPPEDLFWPESIRYTP